MSCKPALAFCAFLAACATNTTAPTASTPPPSGGRTTNDRAPEVQVPAADLPDAPPGDQAVATWDGGQLTWGELQESLKGRLTKMEIDYLTERHDLLKRGIDDTIKKNLLEAEASKRGLPDVQALVKAQVEDKITSVSASEVKAFYEQNKRKWRGKSLEDVREQVEKSALEKKRREAYAAFVDDLKGKAHIQVMLKAPDIPRMDVSVDDDPMRGNPDAPVTIIEFADYQCPYCARGYNNMKKVMDKYGDKVRWIYRDFPLSFHKQANSAARAANCAGEQGKYWEMHDKLFENQKSIGDDDLKGYAKSLGLDMNAWNTCFADKDRHTSEFTHDMSDGQAAGVSGTPAYFINGIMLSGARPLESFAELIDKELEAATK